MAALAVRERGHATVNTDAGVSWIEDGATKGDEPQTLDGGPRTVRESGHATAVTDD